MIYQISFLFLILSFLILTFFFFKKAPQIIELKEEFVKKENIFLWIKKKIVNASFIKEFSWNNILQKLLSKTRVMILKIETKIGDQLHSLRKNSEKKKWDARVAQWQSNGFVNRRLEIRILSRAHSGLTKFCNNIVFSADRIMNWDSEVMVETRADCQDSSSWLFLTGMDIENWNRKSFFLSCSEQDFSFFREFDPSSGWTLAAWIRHASQTAPQNKLACFLEQWQTG